MTSGRNNRVVREGEGAEKLETSKKKVNNEGDLKNFFFIWK